MNLRSQLVLPLLVSSIMLSSCSSTGNTDTAATESPTIASPAPTQSPSVKSEPTTAPEPTAIPTTGDFAADAIAAGLDPSLVGVYEGMGPLFCEPLDAVNQYDYAIDVGMYRNEGKADDVLRLVVQYNCPEKIGNLERVLTLLDS